MQRPLAPAPKILAPRSFTSRYKLEDSSLKNLSIPKQKRQRHWYLEFPNKWSTQSIYSVAQN